VNRQPAKSLVEKVQIDGTTFHGKDLVKWSEEEKKKEEAPVKAPEEKDDVLLIQPHFTAVSEIALSFIRELLRTP
jgi:hypothetical protein